MSSKFILSKKTRPVNRYDKRLKPWERQGCPPVTLLSDELPKRRVRRYGCLDIIRPLALDAFRMAQDVASGQGFLEMEGEEGERGDFAAPGEIVDPTGKWRACLTRKGGRTALQVVLQEVESFAEYAAVFLDPLQIVSPEKSRS
jgi:hypothetical protein